MVIGAVVFWPALLIGLFSIGRRFRTPRRRVIILLSTWGVCLLAPLTTLHLRALRPASDQPAEQPAASELGSDTADESASLTIEGSSPPALSAPRPAPTRLEFDFAAGSDERLVALIDHAQLDRYHAIIDQYTLACRLRPADSNLALERVRFIEHFAGSEDVRIEGIEADLAAAEDWLDQHFPKVPATVLHRMERTFGEPFSNLVRTHAATAEFWPVSARARFLLLRAQRETTDAIRENFARQSFELEPTADAGLILLQTPADSSHREEHRRLVDHPVFDAATPWIRCEIMNTRFDLGQTNRGVALFDQLSAEAPYLVQNSATARRLATAGFVDRAHALLAQLPVRRWNRFEQLRDRFDFELEFGTAADALAAYHAFHALGFDTDPLGRERFALFLKFPHAPWDTSALLSLASFLVFLLFACLAPAIVLLPIHYASLLRRRRGTVPSDSDSAWGLRAAWLVAGCICASGVIGVWFFQPDVLRSWWHPTAAGVTAQIDEHRLLLQQTVDWLVMLVVLGIAVWRARAWRLFGPGRWPAGPAIGYGLAATLGLRIFMLSYTTLWPGSLDGIAIGSRPLITQICSALIHQGGPPALVLVVAVFVPILEETLFRGVLLQSFSNHIPFGWANTLQALLFGLAHFNLRLLPFFFLFGLTAGLLARRSGGLLASMILHGANNLLACIAFITILR